MQDENRIRLISVSAGVVTWVVDAAIDPHYPELPFWTVLVHGGTPHDLLMRSFIFSAFVVFGFVSAKAVAKHRAAQEEKERLLTELRLAMNEVKTLSGLLPICSYCKMIRDCTGSWNKLETYIKKHSEAEFTHGICPECEKRLSRGLTPPSRPAP